MWVVLKIEYSISSYFCSILIFICESLQWHTRKPNSKNGNKNCGERNPNRKWNYKKKHTHTLTGELNRQGLGAVSRDPWWTSFGAWNPINGSTNHLQSKGNTIKTRTSLPKKLLLEKKCQSEIWIFDAIPEKDHLFLFLMIMTLCLEVNNMQFFRDFKKWIGSISYGFGKSIQRDTCTEIT